MGRADSSSGLIIAIIAASIVVAILVIFFCLYRKYKGKIWPLGNNFKIGDNDMEKNNVQTERTLIEE